MYFSEIIEKNPERKLLPLKKLFQKNSNKTPPLLFGPGWREMVLYEFSDRYSIVHTPIHDPSAFLNITNFLSEEFSALG